MRSSSMTPPLPSPSIPESLGSEQNAHKDKQPLSTVSNHHLRLLVALDDALAWQTMCGVGSPKTTGRTSLHAAIEDVGWADFPRSCMSDDASGILSDIDLAAYEPDQRQEQDQRQEHLRLIFDDADVDVYWAAVLLVQRWDDLRKDRKFALQLSGDKNRTMLVFRKKTPRWKFYPSLDNIFVQLSSRQQAQELVDDGIPSRLLVKTDKGAPWRLSLGPGAHIRRCCSSCPWVSTREINQEEDSLVGYSLTQIVEPHDIGQELATYGGPVYETHDRCIDPNHAAHKEKGSVEPSEGSTFSIEWLNPSHKSDPSTPSTVAMSSPPDSPLSDCSSMRDDPTETTLPDTVETHPTAPSFTSPSASPRPRLSLSMESAHEGSSVRDSSVAMTSRSGAMVRTEVAGDKDERTVDREALIVRPVEKVAATDETQDEAELDDNVHAPAADDPSDPAEQSNSHPAGGDYHGARDSNGAIGEVEDEDTSENSASGLPSEQHADLDTPSPAQTNDSDHTGSVAVRPQGTLPAQNHGLTDRLPEASRLGRRARDATPAYSVLRSDGGPDDQADLDPNDLVPPAAKRPRIGSEETQTAHVDYSRTESVPRISDDRLDMDDCAPVRSMQGSSDESHRQDFVNTARGSTAYTPSPEGRWKRRRAPGMPMHIPTNGQQTAVRDLPTPPPSTHPGRRYPGTGLVPHSQGHADTLMPETLPSPTSPTAELDHNPSRETSPDSASHLERCHELSQNFELLDAADPTSQSSHHPASETNSALLSHTADPADIAAWQGRLDALQNELECVNGLRQNDQKMIETLQEQLRNVKNSEHAREEAELDRSAKLREGERILASKEMDIQSREKAANAIARSSSERLTAQRREWLLFNRQMARWKLGMSKNRDEMAEERAEMDAEREALDRKRADLELIYADQNTYLDRLREHLVDEKASFREETAQLARDRQAHDEKVQAMTYDFNIREANLKLRETGSDDRRDKLRAAEITNERDRQSLLTDAQAVHRDRAALLVAQKTLAQERSVLNAAKSEVQRGQRLLAERQQQALEVETALASLQDLVTGDVAVDSAPDQAAERVMQELIDSLDAANDQDTAASPPVFDLMTDAIGQLTSGHTLLIGRRRRLEAMTRSAQREDNAAVDPVDITDNRQRDNASKELVIAANKIATELAEVQRLVSGLTAAAGPATHDAENRELRTALEWLERENAALITAIRLVGGDEPNARRRVPRKGPMPAWKAAIDEQVGEVTRRHNEQTAELFRDTRKTIDDFITRIETELSAISTAVEQLQ